MPELPDFVTIPELAQPTLQPAAGAILPEAIQRGAAAVGATADDFAQGALNQQRATQYGDAVTQMLPQLQDLAFQNSQVPDHQKAHDDFLAGAQGLIDQQVATIGDPFVKSRVETDLKSKAAFMAADVQQNAFSLQQNTQRASLNSQMTTMGQQLAATTDPDMRASIQATVTRNIATALDSHLIAPTEGEDYAKKFVSSSVAVQVEQQRNALEQARDPMGMLSLAMKVNDPTTYPGLIPETREYLGQKLENLAHTYIQTANSQATRAAVEAERALHQSQDRNAAQLLATVYNNPNAVNTGQLLDMARQGLLSPSGVESIHSGMIQGQEGHDDPQAVFHLYDQLGGGGDVSTAVGQALTGGQLSTRTAVSLMDANRAMQEKAFPNAMAKAGYDQLMTGLGADKVKAGFFTDPNIPVLLSSAQGEYFNRVNVQHQDPQAVVADMLPRYIKTQPTVGALPLPRYGTPASIADVGTIWDKTKAAYQAGQLNEGQYQSEGQLLLKYQGILADQAKRATALQSAGKPGAPPAPGISIQPNEVSP